MSGQALTASELAHLAHVSRPTASERLARLLQARLIAAGRTGLRDTFGLDLEDDRRARPTTAVLAATA
jgi:MarR family